MTFKKNLNRNFLIKSAKSKISFFKKEFKKRSKSFILEGGNTN